MSEVFFDFEELSKWFSILLAMLVPINETTICGLAITILRGGSTDAFGFVFAGLYISGKLDATVVPLANLILC